MFDRNRIDWAELQHSAGQATDVPAWLEELEKCYQNGSDPSEEWGQFYSAVLHQGTTYSSTLWVVLALEDIATRHVSARNQFLAFLGYCLMAGLQCSLTGPRENELLWGVRKRARVWALDAGPGSATAQPAWLVADLLQALVVLCDGTSSLARAIRDAAYGEVELEGLCLGCGQALLLYCRDGERRVHFDGSEEVASGEEVTAGAKVGQAAMTQLARGGALSDREMVAAAAAFAQAQGRQNMAQVVVSAFAPLHCPRCGSTSEPSGWTPS